MSAIKCLFCYVVLVVTVISVNAESRTFTSADGQKTLDAKLISHKGGKVKLQINGGREMEVLPSAFSPEDQVFLDKWMSKTPELVNYHFRVDAKQDKVSGTRDNSSYRLVKNEKWGYRVQLTNASRDTVSGFTVKYRLFTTNKADGYYYYSRTNTSKASPDGSFKSPGAMKFNQTLEFVTNTVQIDTVDYDGAGYRYKDKLEGMLLRVIDRKGNVVFDWVTPTNFMSGKTWANTGKGPKKSSGATIK